MESIAAVVIGAGVVGLACARALARRGIETLILERNDAFGMETSARNSEVMHAGLYYPTGSLKARLCVAGREQLTAFCETHGVDHRRCGKLIVATSSAQEGKLATLRQQGEANGVSALQLISGEQARRLEPQLDCCAALVSPSTAIIDSHALMLALLGDAERAGAVLVLRTPVHRGLITPAGIVLQTAAGMQLRAPIVINAAGLWATQVAATLAGFPTSVIPPSFYAKGNYYSLAGRAPFTRLIYPLPESGGLGVHLTLDLAGQARFGPDVEWLPMRLPMAADAPQPAAGRPPEASPAFDYRVDAARAQSFYGQIRRYWPALRDGALAPAYAGIRPKTVGPTDPPGDFVIQGPARHGVTGLVNLFGIESPGLTACLAIADEVVAALD